MGSRYKITPSLRLSVILYLSLRGMMKGVKIMIQMNEYELSEAVIMLIGEDLKIEKKINESDDDYVDRVIE
jgi:hypothetical protein